MLFNIPVRDLVAVHGLASVDERLVYAFNIKIAAAGRAMDRSDIHFLTSKK